jgi:hypothetical protein
MVVAKLTAMIAVNITAIFAYKFMASARQFLCPLPQILPAIF